MLRSSSIKMKLLIIALILAGLPAYADQVVNLEKSEVQAANFLSQCANDLNNKSYTVISGSRGTFQQGILYSFNLTAENARKATLEVRWELATRSYKCTLYQAD